MIIGEKRQVEKRVANKNNMLLKLKNKCSPLNDNIFSPSVNAV